MSPTLVRTEAPFFVRVIVTSCAAPQLAITSALACAGVVLFAEEGEGEVAGLPLGISTEYSGFWPERDVHSVTLWPQAQCICTLWCRIFTSSGTEAVFLVSVIVLCGGAPAVAVAAAL